MKITTRASLLLALLPIVQATGTVAQQFGTDPFWDVYAAAQTYGHCDDPTKGLTPNKLMAYILAPTWWEVVGQGSDNINHTPSPMTLSRGDFYDQFFWTGQKLVGAPYHRAFWHPGIGPWQLDDFGFANYLGMERFNTLDSANAAAQKIQSIYCSCINPANCAGDIFGSWGCGIGGVNCEQTFNTIFNSTGLPFVTFDGTTSSFGGSDLRSCSIPGIEGSFQCVYVNPKRAEGFTDSWTGDPDGRWPLAQPFYVYWHQTVGQTYEWRYWLAVDGGFPTDIAAGRTKSTDSRKGLKWVTYRAADGRGLCDLYKPHGDACRGQYRSDGLTPIPIGTATDERTVKFRGFVSDPAGKQVSLEIELRQITENGGTFKGEMTRASGLVNSGSVAEVTVFGLIPAGYHWQARTKNADGQTTPWISFGDNPDSVADFTVGGRGSIQINATIDGSPWSGPVSYSVSGQTSFTGSQTATYPDLPSGGYTVLYLSGGPQGASFKDIFPPASLLLQAGGKISWSLNFTKSGPPFCQASSSVASKAKAALSAACGGSLSVSLAGTGSGRVLSTPSGIDCPGSCAMGFAAGTQVLLSPNPSPGSTFAGWSGDSACASGSVTMNGSHSCTATFTAATAAYTLTVSETGSGTVSSIDGGITCGGVCSQTYVAGTTVTLTASPAPGWSFSSWSGTCSGGPVVQVAMNSNQSCTANFVQRQAMPPVTTTGAATSITDTSATLGGTVNPNGLPTNFFFEYGPDPGMGLASPPQFVGAGTVSVPISANVSDLACGTTYRFRTVGVNAGGDYRASNGFFTTAACPPAPCHVLTLLKNGDGALPTALPTNSSGCPFGQYHAGDHIALTASAGPGNIITGWAGTDYDASTASTNTATMPVFDRWVVVDYQHICYHLSLGHTGNGANPMVTNPVAYCPTDYFPWGYEVDVTASPATGWQVGGWSGTRYDTSTNASNFILMPIGNQVALVQYTPIQYPLSVTKVGNGSGTVTSDVPGIDCGATCNTSYPYGTKVTLTATAAAGSIFTGWGGGACNGGTATVTAYTVCTAGFVLAPTGFYTLTPCRLMDTRNPNDLNGPAITGGSSRLLGFVGNCGIPSTATAVSLNLTIVNPSADGFLSLLPAIGVLPSTSTINFRQGQVRANNAIVGLNSYGALTVYCAGTSSLAVDYIVDVNGYFVSTPPPSSTVSFSPRLDITVGNEPLGLAIADFDGDGKADVAVGIYDNGSGNKVRILRNIGSPGNLQFDTPFDLTTGSGPERMAAGDLDNDGKPDLVVANPGNSTLTIFRNVSTPGSLSFATVQTLFFPTPHQVVIADFDGDGKPDLIVTSNSGRLVSVFHHASDPNTIAFDSRTDFSLESYPNQLAVADIDGDGKPDILVPLQNTSNLWIYRNTSSPGTVGAQTVSPFVTGTSPEGIAVGDLNADGRIDILVPSVATNSLAVFTNGSSPGSSLSLSRKDWPTGAGPGAVAVGDLNRDGLPDVVVANGGANTITIFRNTSSSGVIDLTAQPDLATPLRPINVVIGDVDGDGLFDIVVANHDSQSISIFLNTTGHP